MSDSVRPHRWQPTRFPRPWDSPGKNTGVGCHFLLQCMKVKSESEVAQSCPTLCSPMDCSPPGSSTVGFSGQEYWSGVPLPSPMPIAPSVPPYDTYFILLGLIVTLLIVIFRGPSLKRYCAPDICEMFLACVIYDP